MAWGWGDFVGRYVSALQSREIDLASVGLLREFIASASIQNALGNVKSWCEEKLRTELKSKCGDCEDGTVTTIFVARELDQEYKVAFESSALFSIWKGILYHKGDCDGEAACKTRQWSGSCGLHFYIRDAFTDPLDFEKWGLPKFDFGFVYGLNADWGERFDWAGTL